MIYLKIENIKVNSFGKLKNKDINLSNGINLIYGKNEAGKSTLLKFIQNIFYGTSKNKKGKNFSDFDLYKPWEEEEFSGKITYKLDSGEKYEVYRDFSKKNPKVYNEQLEDITKKFNINKNTGSEFFYEQTNVDEFMFLASIVSMQQEVRLNMQDQNILVQKIANLASTGDDSVSYKKAIDRLNKKQLDEIGTDRSQGKPINIAKNEIIECEEKLKNLENLNNNKFELDKKEQDLEEQIEKNRVKNYFLKELIEIKNEEKLELEKLNFKEQLKEKNNSQIKELEEELSGIRKEQEENNKNSQYSQKTNHKKNIKFMPYLIFSLICIILGIVSYFATKNIAITLIFALITISILGIYIFNKNKANNKNKIEEKNVQQLNNNINEKISIIQNKIELIQKNNEELDLELKELNNKIDMQIDLKKENLKAKYISKISLNEINSYQDKDNLSNELVSNEEIIHKYELNLNMLNLEKKQTLDKLEELINIKEKLDFAKERYVELQKQNEKINKAKELITIAYEKMKNNVTPKFTQNLSNIIEKISDGKYNKIYVNDETGMVVGLPNGEYVEAEKLSAGTIEQLYLSLRLSMAKEISKETMPIILDEAFAYYDDERLENTLRFLIENFKENQILIFTCTNREEKILNNLNTKFEKIKL